MKRLNKKQNSLSPLKPKDTSWGKVANWYDDYLENNSDTYQEQVIAPNLLRIVSPKKGDHLLDIACGQGFFTRKFADAGAEAVGTDISKELINQARTRSPKIQFHVAPADKLSFAEDNSFDVVTIVFAIQNIQNIQDVFAEVRRILSPKGRMVLVMNHPAFRIPKRSSWGWAEKEMVQFRRIDGYLSGSTNLILMHPGKTSSESTISYHRSLQDFFKALNKGGFAVSRLEEWISHKKSGKGPKQKAEDIARKEIPLFLMIEAKKS